MTDRQILVALQREPQWHDERFACLKHMAERGIGAFQSQFREHEDRIGNLVERETALFLATLLLGFLGTVLGTVEATRRR